MLREALEISSPLALISGEVPRFHDGSLWHSTPVFQPLFAFCHNLLNYVNSVIIGLEKL